MNRPYFSLIFFFFLYLASMGQSSFVKVKGKQFTIDDKPYYFIGTNFWYGMNLGSIGKGGDRARLIRELDRLEALGINNLRIMAASEGPDSEPWRMVPSLQTAPGQYNQELLEGLDFLLVEMGKRNMKAVVCLNNFWPWSGGMAQYVAWSNESSIPYPMEKGGSVWVSYMSYTNGFYQNEAARNAADDHVSKMIKRVNSITGKPYIDDPTIMAWQLANEPRGMLKPKAYRTWVEHSASLIKNLDPNHLISIGSEGATPTRLAGTRFRKDHKIKHIDYATFHIWIQNWGWYNPEKHDSTYEGGLKRALKYLNKHIAQANRLGMPVVMEEFGIARDQDDHDASAPSTARDAYYQAMFEKVYQLAKEGKSIAGANFWAWGGEGRPREPKGIWKPGDDWIGDPPHEYQGWYSVYEKDISTLEVIRAYTQKMKSLGN